MQKVYTELYIAGQFGFSFFHFAHTHKQKKNYLKKKAIKKKRAFGLVLLTRVYTILYYQYDISLLQPKTIVKIAYDLNDN